MTIIEGRNSISGSLDTVREATSEFPAFEFDVAIVGLGYVGLPTALAFHAAGRRVVGVDVSAERLAAIRDERVDLLATDRARLSLALADEGLTLGSDPALLASAEAVIVCVPTPVD